MNGKMIKRVGRVLVALVCLVFCMSTFMIPALAEGEITGEWVLVGQPMITSAQYDVPPGTRNADGDLFETTLSIADGSANYADKKTFAPIGTPDPDEPLMYTMSDASFTFQRPPERMKPGEQLSFAVTGTYAPLPDDYYCIDGNTVDLDSQSQYLMEDNDSDYLSDSEGFGEHSYMSLDEAGTQTLSFAYIVPSYYEGVKQLVIAYAIVGDNGRQEIGYLYEFKSTNQREIKFTGQITDIKGNIMPYMLVSVKGELDDNGNTISIPETFVQTDVTGVFEWSGYVPLQATGKLILRAQIYMQCWLKDAFTSRTDKTAFYIADLNSADSTVPTYAATTLFVDLSLPEYKNTEPVEITRYIDFMFTRMASPFLSFQDKNTRDMFDTNASSAKSLAAMSYLYTQAFNGLYTGVKTFEEKGVLMGSAPALRIETNGLDKDSSYFMGDPQAPYIHISESETAVTDLARFTILHEYGHWFDFITNTTSAMHCTPALTTSVNANHGGYMNDDTSDSVMEGFASWFCCVAQQNGLFPIPQPEVMSVFGSAAGSSLAWSEAGKREEFSVTRALWASSNVLGAKEVWKNAMAKQHNALSQYYADLINACQDAAASDSIKSAFLRNGLYTLDAGNGAYDADEPFRDDPQLQNGRPNVYDTGDPFADIPAALPAGIADAAGLGAPTDKVRARSTAYLYENSFITLTGSVPEYVIVTVEPEQGDAYAYTITVKDSRVYLGLPVDGSAGQVTITIPGGKTVYEGDTAALHDKLLQSFGTDDALESVAVPASAHPTEPVIVGTTDGVVGSGSVINVTEERLYPTDDFAYNPTSFTELSDSELESIIQANTDHVSSVNAGQPAADVEVSGEAENPADVPEPDSIEPGTLGNDTNLLTIALVIIAAVVVIAVIIVILVLAGKKNKRMHPPAAPPYQNQGYYPPNQPVNQPPANYGFCDRCGSPKAADGSCPRCGTIKCRTCGTICDSRTTFCNTCGKPLR